MKKFFLIILIVLLVVLFGTFPLGLLSKLFEWISIGVKWLANVLDFFNWNGIL